MTDGLNVEFQLATTAALARLEQRAEDFARRDDVTQRALREISVREGQIEQRLTAIEQSRSNSRAVLGFTRAAFGIGVVIISTGASVAARFLT
jgi:hypothetical protein